MSIRHALRPAIFVGALLLPVTSRICVAEAPISASVTDAIKWHPLGSFHGDWANMVAGISSRPDTFYPGTADGRTWTTADAEYPWYSHSNTQSASSIGMLEPPLARPDQGVIHVGSDRASVAEFLDEYWQQPLAPQGLAPPQFTALEAALDPASCGTCHVQQFRDWSGARHAKAMGPGVLGQLMNMDAEARDEQQNCIRCHAPLAEQADSLAAALSTRNAGTGAGLYEQGVICSACHVRGNQRFGPPRRDGSAPKSGDASPHGAWQASNAFSDSRFCASCHQFKTDGFALNGKLLENTYAEWKASPYANEGRQCQSCHMPDRRHLWRGIHDAEMVRSGVSIGIVPPRFERGILHTALSVRNTGTGHDFPTYVTPRVLIEILQEDAAGHAIDGTRREYVIARQVALDLSHEIADTRLAPGAQATLIYALPWLRRATKLRYHVAVEPDAYYTRFYRAQVAAGAGTGEALIRQALAESLASRYTLFLERRAIDMAAK